ncbi:MAG: hypothetical protein CM15mP77_0970 [Synechococcus sp.]|nr:MAG: hypothetical protein CM15mP77_0970 [Synechococcus sp.]
MQPPHQQLTQVRSQQGRRRRKPAWEGVSMAAQYQCRVVDLPPMKLDQYLKWKGWVSLAVRPSSGSRAVTYASMARWRPVVAGNWGGDRVVLAGEESVVGESTTTP